MTQTNSLSIDVNEIGTNLNRNLSELMERNAISLSTLHRNTAIAIPTIKRFQSDPATNPTIATLLPIANFFGLTVTDLISNLPLPNNGLGFVDNKTHWLKLAVIQWNEVVDWLKPHNAIETAHFILVNSEVGENAFALKVEEEDWLAIPKGSILIINKDLAPDNKDYALVLKKGQSAPALKQILIEEDNIYLKSPSPHFPTIAMTDDYCFLGVLMQIRKDMRA
ncbi:MAG: helix-turn-helix domain-containing protein [Silvanigrellaceae bacterium]|nr:helix-turn-helix domain-containing protein [Silvanigrellaceae bacterium]